MISGNYNQTDKENYIASTIKKVDDDGRMIANVSPFMQILDYDLPQ